MFFYKKCGFWRFWISKESFETTFSWDAIKSFKDIQSYFFRQLLFVDGLLIMLLISLQLMYLIHGKLVTFIA
jgi:hypothetical protein